MFVANQEDKIMPLSRIKTDGLYDRAYTSDPDKAADQWVTHVNERKCVDDVSFVMKAKKIVGRFDQDSVFRVQVELRQPAAGAPIFFRVRTDYMVKNKTKTIRATPEDGS